MSWLALLPLLGIWTLAVISPGPDFLITLRYSAGRSRGSGLRVAAGVVTGIAVWALAALFGLTVVIERFEWLYTITRAAGAVFLIVLGVATIRAARRPAAAEAGEQEPRLTADHAGGMREWRVGLLTNLANPKAVVFFGALFASLLPHGTSVAAKAATLVTMLAIAFAWFAVVAFLAATPVITKGYRNARKRLDILTGGLFIGMGGLLIPR
ncbi:LysE family transporter [Sphaerisporangium perillae]|uniref:LysE family transporter n=1 Tax=Sphaerisporangium perillae TaxID=2935860 RepID=UPI00200D7CBD|nr:LysE family transporter [Sphaerisporangium perillae]